jgi:hypothetical protein
MAIKPLNSVGGFSVGLPAKNIIDSNGNITTTSANLTGNLSAGTGNLSFDSTTNILSVLGNIVSTNANLGNLVTANYFAGVLTNAEQPNITSVGTLSSLSVSGNVAAGNVSTSGLITGGNVTTGGAVSAATVSASGAITGASLSATGATTTGSLTVSGLTSLGNIGNVGITGGVANYVISTDGAGNLSWVSPAAAAGLAGSNTQVQFNNGGAFGASADFTFNNATNTLSASFFTGTLTTAAQPNVTSVGILSSVSVAGNANVGNLGTAGLISATGNVTGNYIIGNGSALTDITGANVTGQVANALVSGTVYTAAQPNITSVGTLSSLSVSGNVAAGNVSTSGLINAGNISATGNINASNFNGNLYGNFFGNVDAAGSNTQVQFAGANDQLDASAGFTFDKTSNAMSVAGTATVGNLSTAGVVSATGLITGGNVTTVGSVSAGTLTVSGVSSLGAVGNVSITGGTAGQFLQTNGTGGLSFATIGTSGIANGTSNVDIPVSNGNVNTSVGGTPNVLVVTATGANVTGTINSTGNATVGNLSTAGLITATGNVTGNYFIGNGSALTGINGANVTGQVANALVSGTVYTNAQPNITSVGTLTSVSISGNVNAGNLSTAGLITGGNITTAGAVSSATISASGNADIGGNLSTTGNITVGSGTGGTISGANLVSANFFTGTLTTAAQPNITSVGSLTSLSVIGTATVGNVSTAGTISSTGTATVGNLSTGGTISATGNITGNYFVGNGSLLTGVTAVSAQTVTNNAQPNITSVGTLTSVSVSGNADVGNLITVGLVSATGTGTFGNVSTGGAVSATGLMTAGNITTAGAVNAAGLITGGNITTAGAVTSATLSVSGTATVGNVSTVGFLSAQGNITSNANVITDFIVARTAGSLEIATTGTDTSINLKPQGTGSVDVNSKKITNLATPTAPADAATKQYVDDVAQGLHVHASCNAATTTTLAVISGGTVTYNNGTDGVGATLTTTGTYTTIDGVTLTNGMRILVKNEVAPANNGIYVRTSSTVLTRATDFDTGAEIQGGDFTFVTGGTQYNSTGWVQVDEVTVVGTDPIEWLQFSGAGEYTAGQGLRLDGNQFNANVAPDQLEINGSNQIAIKAGAVLVTPNIGAATGTSLSVTGTVTAADFSGPLSNGSSNVFIPAAGGNVNISVGGTPNVFVVTSTGANVAGALGVTGNVTASNFIGNFIGNISGNITIPGANTAVVFNDGGFANTSSAFTFNKDSNVVTVSSVLAVTANTQITGATVTTSSTNAVTIATFPKAGITGVEYIVKGIAAGTAYSMATVQAVTDGTAVDYSVFGTLGLGAATFTDLVVVVAGSNIELKVNAASSTSTVWTTQYRLI